MARDAVAEVRDRTDIVELVSNYVQLKKTGRSYKGLCPFHQEKTPSFIVFPDSGNFHCFGCGKGGDVFTFYMGVENAEFKEALGELARRAGIQLDTIPTVAPEVDAHRNRLVELNELAAGFYANALLNSAAGEQGRKLAEQRGLSQEMITRFQLGFAPDGWDNLHKYLAQRGVDPALAAEAGLLQVRDNGGYYDRFRNRFLFPIRDRDGRVVGFGGRALGDAQPKYLNSPQSAIFDKSSLLYGLDVAKDEIRKRDQVVIVEGYMDAIAAHQFGHANVVAAMGTAVTETQIALLKRFSKRIVLALDADAAGQMATIRSLESMTEALDHSEVPIPDARGVVRFERKLDAQISIVSLPVGKDPDELIRRDPGSWPEVVASAKPFIDFYIDTVVGEMDPNDPRAKSAAVGRVAPLLQQVADRIIQAHYINLLAQRLRLPEREVASEIRRRSLTSQAPVMPAAQRRVEVVTQSSLEDHLIALFLRYRPLLRTTIAATPTSDLADARNRELMVALNDPTIPDMEPIEFIAGLDDVLADHAERLLERLEGKPSLTPGLVQKEAMRTLEQIGKDRYEFLLRELTNEIVDAEQGGDRDMLDGLKQQITALSARHRSFYPPKSPYFRDSRDPVTGVTR